MTRADRISIALAAVAPPLIAVAFYYGELATHYNRPVAIDLQWSDKDRLQTIVTTQTALAQLLIGFATSVIGGLAYYVRNRRTSFETFPPAAFVSLVLSLICCILSVYFGQMWISNIVVELINKTFLALDANVAFEVVFPQNAQYMTFLLALCWAAIVVLVQERQRVAGTKAA
jgi:hypothetical protein